MINKRILNEFREHSTDPHYIVLITDMQNGEPICNEESLIISTKQIFLSLEEYLQNPDDTTYKTVERDLTIYSNIGINDNNLYVGELNGYISKEKATYAVPTSNTESPRWIEIVDTVLQKTIDITFNREYKEQPRIYPNIDKEFEKLYRNISYDYIDNGKEGDEKRFIGIQLIFNNLRSTNSYPNISIVIIGDEKEDKYDEEGNIEPTYHNLTATLYYKEFDKNTNQEKEIPIEGTTVLINETETISDECGSITENLIEGDYIITPPSEIKINDVKYTSKAVSIKLEEDTSIGIEMKPILVDVNFHGTYMKDDEILPAYEENNAGMINIQGNDFGVNKYNTLNNYFDDNGNVTISLKPGSYKVFCSYQSFIENILYNYEDYNVIIDYNTQNIELRLYDSSNPKKPLDNVIDNERVI